MRNIEQHFAQVSAQLSIRAHARAQLFNIFLFIAWEVIITCISMFLMALSPAIISLETIDDIID